MTDNEIVSRVQKDLGGKIGEIANPAPRRIFVSVDATNLIDGLKYLKDQLEFAHLSTITGIDKGEVFEILYHLANPFTCLTVRTTIPRNYPHIPTITGVIPGAILYERELQDMFGIVVEQIPDPRPLVLPDNWPAGVYPLRKDWKFERPPEKIPGGG
ncbi:MAG TPA: NADH-quinone oxidoreductase subunit C [bacterium]